MLPTSSPIATSDIDLLCPACCCRGEALALVVEDRYRLIRCPVCRSQYFRADGQLSGSSSGTDSEYWEDYKFSVYSDPAVQAEFEGRYREFLGMALGGSPGLESVLDVGCGIGNFVGFAEREGWRSYGVDVEARAVERAVDRGLRVAHTSELSSLLRHERGVDLITLWDVIEHLFDPSTALSEIVEDLRPGGFLLLETPDGEFPLRAPLRLVHEATNGRIDYTAPMYYWEHKIYFSETGLRILLARHGLDVEQVVRRTSPREKMQQVFDHNLEESRSIRERALARLWPVLERTVRATNSGNKLIVLARRRQPSKV